MTTKHMTYRELSGLGVGKGNMALLNEGGRRTHAIDVQVAQGILRRIERLPEADCHKWVRHLAAMHTVKYNAVLDEDWYDWPAGRQLLRQLWTLCDASCWLNPADAPDGPEDMLLWHNAVWEAAWYARYGYFTMFEAVGS